MKSSTAFNHYERLKGWATSELSGVRIYLSTHADLLTRLSEKIYSDPAYKKLPCYYRTKISTLIEERMEDITNKQTVWMYDIGAELPVDYDSLTDFQRAKACCKDGIVAHRYWLREITRHGKTWHEHDGKKFSRHWELTNKIWF